LSTSVLFFFSTANILLSSSGIVLVCKINMFFLEKLRMKVKYYWVFLTPIITDFIQYISGYIFSSESQVPLKYPCAILFWLSMEIFKTIITWKKLFYSNIIYCIQYYHSLFNIWLNNIFYYVYENGGVPTQFQNIVFGYKMLDKEYFHLNYFLTILAFTIWKSYYVSEQKTKKTDIICKLLFLFYY
jgi:hypothetical protein